VELFPKVAFQATLMAAQRGIVLAMASVAHAYATGKVGQAGSAIDFGRILPNLPLVSKK
jgi:hypothetical protein